MISKSPHFIAVVALLVFVLSSTHAAEWYVDASVATSGDGTIWDTAFKTIQEGIDAASDGDAVIVAEGTYNERIHFKGKNIIVTSTDPLDPGIVANTIIDGAKKSGSVVNFAGTENDRCVLCGFTVRNGTAENGGGICGGTRETRTRATIENNVISENVATGEYGRGGGIAFCDGLIQNNTLVGNSAVNAGGAIAHCHGLIQGNRIHQNSVEIDVGGGLAYCHGVIQHNLIFDNTAGEEGGGLFCCHGAIRGNLIYGNSAPYGGGMGYCHGLIENNTVTRNHATERGGGVMGCGVSVLNCIIWENTAGIDGAQVYDLPNPSYSCVQSWPGGGEGNIAGDPQFIDFAGNDFRLSANSPCLDVGRNGDWMWQAMDAEGNARILRGTSAIRVDMGAYEHDPDPPEGARWHVDSSVSDSGDGTSWETAFQTIQEAMNAAAHGDTVLVAQGIYTENIRFSGKNIVLRSSGDEGASAPSATVIDGGQTGPVVTFSGTEDERCLLSGFTIRNGNAPSGGGILGGTQKQRTRARIENNLIVGNSATSGAGIAYCAGPVLSNTIADNSATSEGGGLLYCSGAIRNCIIWGNSGESQVYQSSTPTFSCIKDGAVGEESMRHYPHFVDKDHGDYHLQSWSPCIDAGDSGARFFMEPEPSGRRVDIGAYGNTAEATSRSLDSDADRLPDDGEVAFLGGLSLGPEHDLDEDLAPNLQEYHRGTDPTIPQAVTFPANWYVDGSVEPPGDGRSWSGAFRTIQEGIDACSDGDTVTVAEGIYTENIAFNGKNIILQSTDPADTAVVAATIIDGGHANSVVVFVGIEDESCVLAGFTIRNGSADHGAGICGGTPLHHTRATIRRNVLTNNSALSGGGVAFCDGTMTDSTITGNAASRSSNAPGGVPGVAGHGGGLFRCDASISNNDISRNTAALFGGGLTSCDGTIRNNVMSRNSCQIGGGGLIRCDGMIENNTICKNSAALIGGGGLAGCFGMIANCIVWGNTAPDNPQLSTQHQTAYCCIQGWTASGEGNITKDPKFFNYAAEDYRLSEISPCVDAGRHEEWMWHAVDLDGNPRIWNDTVDMGAYEYGSFPFKVVSLIKDAGEAELTWNSRPGDTYRIWSCSDLLAADWSEEETVASHGETTSWKDSDASAVRKFYRIKVE